MLHWVAADADAHREIVEEDQLVPCKRSRFVRYMTRWRQWQRVANGSHCHPCRTTTIRFPAAERSRASQLQRVGALELRPLNDVVDRRKSIPASRGFKSVERFLTQSADVPPANAEGGPIGIVRRLVGAFPIPIAHAGRQNLQSVTAGVMYQC